MPQGDQWVGEMLNHMGAKDDVMRGPRCSLQRCGDPPQLWREMRERPNRGGNHLCRRVQQRQAFGSACDFNQRAAEITRAAARVKDIGAIGYQTRLCDQPAIGGGITQPLNLTAPAPGGHVISVGKFVIGFHGGSMAGIHAPRFRGIAKNTR